MILVLGLAAWAVAAPLQEPETGVIRGAVRSERTGEPVPYAVVEVASSPAPLRAVADSLGTYLVQGVPAGRRLVRARALDHRPLEIEVLVPAGREVRVDFGLRLDPVPLVGLTVGGDGDRGVSGGGDPGELGRAVVHSLEATPGVAELGLLELGRAVGNGQEPVDPTDVLYVRGAPADLKRVLLDGAPVYAPFQAGGLLQAFEPDLVRRADLYLGGAPARYDGGLSYLLDLETKAGDRKGFGSTGAADLLTAKVMLEGPLGPRAGVLMGARAVHGAGAPWLMNERFPSGYADLLGRADIDIGASGQLQATGFWNRESVSLADDPARVGEEAVWGNRAGSLRYRGMLAGRKVEATLARGLYQARLPLGSAQQRVMVDGSARQTRVAIDVGSGGDLLRVNYGVSYEEMVLNQRARTAQGAGYVETSASGEAGGAYVDLDWSAAPRVRVRGGVRADLFSVTGSLRFAPRLAVAWAFSERAVLTLAGGRFRQLVRGGDELRVDSLGVITGAGQPRSTLRAAEAMHLLLGIDQLLTDRVRLGIEGFYKRFDDIPAEMGLTHANASGIDLWLRGGTSRLSGWLGYSLAWVWTGAATSNTTATDLFSGRQLLSLGVTADIGDGGRIGARLGYGAGVPYTAVPSGTGTMGEQTLNGRTREAALLDSARELVLEAPPIASAPNAPNGPYLRLDAEISYPVRARWGGSPITLTPYLKIYNALDRRDALFYLADGSTSGKPRPVATLPVLPVVGVEWRF